VKTLKYVALPDGSMNSFKNREKVLTRLESLDYTGISKGFRIIVRLYPIHRGQNPCNPLIYKGFLLVLPYGNITVETWYFEINKCRNVFVTLLIPRGYDFLKKVGLLKLSRVLTCKKFPCKKVACTMWSL
jgi:hypothetical protein